MIQRSLIFRILLLLVFLPGATIFAQEAAIAEGSSLFKANCASCHNKNMKDDLTGPALGGVEERWADYPQEDLYAWIRNSQKMIGEGHPRAVQLFNDWNKSVMNSFTQFSDEQIANVLAYIDYQYNFVPEGDVTSGPVVTEEEDNSSLFLVITIGLIGLILVLMRVASKLNVMVKVEDGEELEPERTLFDVLTSKSMIATFVLIAVVAGGSMMADKAINLGRQQGYMPDQPIKFSHATHTGLNKVDCNYCHDGARRSKHSVIPAANTCMNCHKAIKKGSTYGTAELTKIFASIGFDPKSGTYLEDYENMDVKEIEKIFKTWIESQSDETDLEKLEAQVEGEWDAIVSSLTNDRKDDFRGPIEWIRIHNLPDHVYFNHAQHVKVGQVECESCHGKVEEMEVVEQYSPLSMGWCINCHRKTEVKFDGNEYYKSYENYHNQLSAGDREKVTVEEIGGLECQKCHY